MLLFSLLQKLSDSAVLIPFVSIQLVIVFCLKTRERALPRGDRARLGMPPAENGEPLSSRPRLLRLPGQLRASGAAGGAEEAAAAAAAETAQRGRLVQGSQPGPALMLGARSEPGPGPAQALRSDSFNRASSPAGAFLPLSAPETAAPPAPASS